ncbi:hypothetical protein PC116_g16632 [Phytophthora cactorum]|uniref:Armadillo-type fold n=1 Tax=Phytophthora cactorum TaxID=29920 RepID=A0A8T0YUJ7_9STRA|nr:hypothetical protein PC111_g12684 [Phytophthora cactorum]KAG2817917.1 hypothetical protein PC112_g12854 [Phytophthora cactorum]KAG2852483.1 hypothetical protein PC113_g14988 [Phytophthora cactorum]KAG2893093.1 hypothetical protein PC114_g16383 [Phytophthora cactorum]KAG2912564.1 hypothetical protein PC115_g12303 [Phytophthora cactorum]
MAEQLAACARQLFEGVSGSGEQRAANAWIMQFQRRDEAWQAALQLLETPVHDPLTHQTLVGPELVAMQILRLKTQHEWTRISVQQQQVVRQTLLKLLEMTCVTDGGLLPTWTGWKSDVQRLVDAGIAAQRQQKGAAVLAEVLGAIPLQILASERMWPAEEMHEILTIFQAEGEEVLTAVHMILTNIADERSSALRCLEGWIVGSVPTHETFGLTAAHLYTRGLIDVLFNVVISDNEEQAQLAAGIIADSFVNTMSAPVSESMVNAVLHSGHRLVESMPVFQSEVRSPTGEIMTKEQQTTACRGISRIACSLAMNHAPTLLWNHVVDTQASLRCSTSEQQSSLSMAFLELLLACSSYDDIDVVQPTLEIWFFFLEDNSSQSEASWQLLDTSGKEHVVSVLSRLVNALIERCKYPQWFVDKQQLVSDDPEIEAISDLRREIADTMLSLFSKWPGGPGKPTGDYASCVKGMCQMLSDSKDVALIDALLFLLSYMVELFDAISSDSESEDDPESFQDPESGGIDVLLGALDRALNLPMHPLVINGVARYLRSLSASLALPASVYLRASMIICQGLQYPSSFPVAVQSLLHSSSSITKYTTVEERESLLQALLQFCSTLQTKTTQESEGDLLEVTFRFASGVSDADFGALCSTVLSNPTVRVQSGNPIDASSSVYMLGRALGGVQDPQQGSALVDQLWSVVSASLLQHKGDESCRRAGVQFFLYVIPHLQKESVHPIEAQVLNVCMWWYGEGLAPDILTCCSRIIARQRDNTGFQVSAEQAFERLLAGFRSKLHDTAGTSSDGGILSMESFLSEHHEADKLIPEVEQFMKLAREVLSSFPQVLMKNRSNGEPTLYWVCLDLATRLLKVDHQMQEMCDAACDFLLDAMRCQPEPILERINIFASEVVRVVLSFLGPRREHYRARNLWDFLFQCIHAPQIPTQIRGGFLAAMSTVVIEEGALYSLLPAEVYQQMPGELRMRRQRHRFRQYFTQLGHAVEAANS